MIVRNQFFSDNAAVARSQLDRNRRADQSPSPAPPAPLELDELRRALAALARRPARGADSWSARAALHEEVAEIADCAVGTIEGRSAGARDHVASSLWRRGSFEKDDLPAPPTPWPSILAPD